MKAHLSGQKHKKALLQRGISLTVKHSDPPTSNTEPTTSIKPKQSPEEQIKAAWTHEILCGFNYYEKGSDIHRATSPHFTYFSKHVPVPGVLKYLRQEN